MLMLPPEKLLLIIHIAKIRTSACSKAPWYSKLTKVSLIVKDLF
jgi:hypothetical protein